MVEKPKSAYFQSDVDNICGCKQFENYMIAPLLDQFGRSIGIMQMFNFAQPITAFQLDRFKAI